MTQREQSKAQDAKLMGVIEETLSGITSWDGPFKGLQVMRVHERNIQVAFPDGRVVSLVLYGPRGKA